MRCLIVLVALVTCAFAASTVPAFCQTTANGTATVGYIDSVLWDGRGSCSLGRFCSSPVMAAMASIGFFRAGKADGMNLCGVCVRMYNLIDTSYYVDVMITGALPMPPGQQFLLHQDAFDMLDDYDDDSAINVSWHYIPCQRAGNVVLSMRAASTYYNLEFDMRNIPFPITIMSYTDQLSKSYNLTQDYSEGFGWTVGPGGSQELSPKWWYVTGVSKTATNLVTANGFYNIYAATPFVSTVACGTMLNVTFTTMCGSEFAYKVQNLYTFPQDTGSDLFCDGAVNDTFVDLTGATSYSGFAGTAYNESDGVTVEYIANCQTFVYLSSLNQSLAPYWALINEEQKFTGRSCGTCMNVTSNDITITVWIRGVFQGGPSPNLMLQPEAMAALGQAGEDYIDVYWTPVSCSRYNSIIGYTFGTWSPGGEINGTIILGYTELVLMAQTVPILSVAQLSGGFTGSWVNYYPTPRGTWEFGNNVQFPGIVQITTVTGLVKNFSYPIPPAQSVPVIIPNFNQIITAPCPGSGNCNNHGACNAITSTCTCTGGWTTAANGCTTAPVFTCPGGNCNSHGNCDSTTGTCTCSGGWSLDTNGNCTVAPTTIACPGNGNCDNHGTCDSTTGVCTCSSGWSLDTTGNCTVSTSAASSISSNLPFQLILAFLAFKVMQLFN